jgi:hypothetical protein
MLEGKMRRHNESVLLDNTRWNAEILRIGAIIEEEVLAEILLAAFAEETSIARSGIHGEDAVAHCKPCARSHFRDHTRELMTEDDGRLEHHCVVPAAVDLEVRAAGEGRANPHDDLAGSSLRHVDTFHAQIVAAVQHRGQHGVGHGLFSHFRLAEAMGNPPLVSRQFKEPFVHLIV